MGRAHARSAQIGGPDCISHVFQVSTYSGEPSASILARNLLSKDNWRVALRDEAVKLGPQVALVGGASVLASGGKRLAGATSGPNGATPSDKSQGIGPSADPSEEMTLREIGEIARNHVCNAAVIDDAIGEHLLPQ